MKMSFQPFRLKYFSTVLIRSFSLLSSKSSRNLFPVKNSRFGATMSSPTSFERTKVTQISDFNVGDCEYLTSRLDHLSYVDLLDKELEFIEKSLVQEDCKELTDALNWCSKVFDYNVKDGKKIRGIALIKAYFLHGRDPNLTSSELRYDEEWKFAIILAWCVEMLQAFFLICDDIMDQSELRRGKPCWYKDETVGLCAVNDSLLLQCGIYKLLQKHLGNEDCYDEVLEEFLQATQKTVYGQTLDMLSKPPNGRPKYEKFTFEKYVALVEHKTAYYTYCLPVRVGLHLAGRSTDEDFQLVTELCLKLGLYFQSQDDYLDCFGDPSVTGKKGNDIREGKCTWFAVKFLEIANFTQRGIFRDTYGYDNDLCHETIMDLYKEVSIISHFEEYEREIESQLCSLMEDADVLKRCLFYDLYKQIKKREK